MIQSYQQGSDQTTPDRVTAASGEEKKIDDAAFDPSPQNGLFGLTTEQSVRASKFVDGDLSKREQTILEKARLDLEDALNRIEGVALTKPTRRLQRALLVVAHAYWMLDEAVRPRR